MWRVSVVSPRRYSINLSPREVTVGYQSCGKYTPEQINKV
jgi:hypothetical protein